jgi:hypothetical protein
VNKCGLFSTKYGTICSLNVLARKTSSTVENPPCFLYAPTKTSAQGVDQNPNLDLGLTSGVRRRKADRIAPRRRATKTWPRGADDTTG